ncbi:MAG: carbohydrate ABC transporter permease [Anaerolineae bacterium]|nr:carbohydrate ABC transporter permease [Anaerolineae bacterium]
MNRTLQAFRILLAITSAIVTLFPLYWMVATSFKSGQEINTYPPVFWPASVSLNNYGAVLEDLPFGQLMLNSFIVSSVITVSTLFASSLAGYVFEKFKTRLTEFFFWVIISIMMIPFPVIMLPVYLLFRDLKLLNSLQGIIIPGLVGPFAIFLMRQHMKSIPNELLDAARMDGASEFGIFLRIVIPNSIATLTALGIFEFMFYWEDFLWPLLVSQDVEYRTLPVGLAIYRQSYGPMSTNLIMAGAIIALAPILFLFVIGRRNFVQGMT